MTCLRCGAGGLTEGFLAGKDQIYEKWVEGPLKRNFIGGAKLSGRRSRTILAYACRECGHLELFTGEDDG